MSLTSALKTDSPLREPLKLKGVLEKFKHFDVTPCIGREYENVNLKEWLRVPNSDELIRDLAITSMVTFQPITFVNLKKEISL